MKTPIPFAENTPDGCLLRVKAQPRASKNEISGIMGDALKIRITAPPVDSAANIALRDFLARELGVPKSSVQQRQGATSRNKIFLIEGIQIDELADRLGLANSEE